MIGIVLVTHGGLAREFLAALEHIVGPQRQAAAICIGSDDDITEKRDAIIAALADVDSGKGVVVLTDMFGGTPSNLAMSVLGTRRVEVIAGVNLPMLVKLAQLRGEKPFAEVVSETEDAGRRYINAAAKLLDKKT